MGIGLGLYRYTAKTELLLTKRCLFPAWDSLRKQTKLCPNLDKI